MMSNSQIHNIYTAASYFIGALGIATVILVIASVALY
jgi:hypothetical protein